VKIREFLEQLVPYIEILTKARISYMHFPSNTDYLTSFDSMGLREIKLAEKLLNQLNIPILTTTEEGFIFSHLDLVICFADKGFESVISDCVEYLATILDENLSIKTDLNNSFSFMETLTLSGSENSLRNEAIEP
jgi:hypothetical protein